MGLVKFTAAWGPVKQQETITWSNLQLEECTICLELMGNDRTKVDCNHEFHTKVSADSPAPHLRSISYCNSFAGRYLHGYHFNWYEFLMTSANEILMSSPFSFCLFHTIPPLFQNFSSIELITPFGVVFSKVSICLCTLALWL